MSETKKRLSSNITREWERLNITYEETDDNDDHQHKRQRDWSDLTPDILYSIVEKLDYVDLIRCCSVCKVWNSIAVQLKPNQNLPWLVEFCVTDNGSLGTRSSYNLSQDKVYQSCYYPILDSSGLDKDCSFKFYASKHGWIFLMVTYYLSNSCELLCYNPFSRKKIKLPSLDIAFNLKSKGAFSANPMSSDCMFFVVDSEFSAGRYRITKIMTYKYAAWELLTFNRNLDLWDIQDVVYCNRFLYCSTRNGSLGAFDITNRSWNMVEAIYSYETLTYYHELRNKLIDLDEEILIVAFHYNSKLKVSICEHVYRLERSNLAWVKLESLDNLALFFDSYGYLVSTTEESKYYKDGRGHLATSKNYKDGRVFIQSATSKYYIDGRVIESPMHWHWDGIYNIYNCYYSFQIWMDPSS